MATEKKATPTVRFHYPNSQRYYILDDSSGYVSAEYGQANDQRAERRIVVRDRQY